MIFKVFTIYDSKVEVYMQPFFAKTTGEAMRMISDACADPEHHFNKHSCDFCLFELGTYDDAIGYMHNLVSPKSLGLLTEYCKVIQ